MRLPLAAAFSVYPLGGACFSGLLDVYVCMYVYIGLSPHWTLGISELWTYDDDDDDDFIFIFTFASFEYTIVCFTPTYQLCTRGILHSHIYCTALVLTFEVTY